MDNLEFNINTITNLNEKNNVSEFFKQLCRYDGSGYFSGAIKCNKPLFNIRGTNRIGSWPKEKTKRICSCGENHVLSEITGKGFKNPLKDTFIFSFSQDNACDLKHRYLTIIKQEGKSWHAKVLNYIKYHHINNENSNFLLGKRKKTNSFYFQNKKRMMPNKLNPISQSLLWKFNTNINDEPLKLNIGLFNVKDLTEDDNSILVIENNGIHRISSSSLEKQNISPTDLPDNIKSICAIGSSIIVCNNEGIIIISDDTNQLFSCIGIPELCDIRRIIRHGFGILVCCSDSIWNIEFNENFTEFVRRKVIIKSKSNVNWVDFTLSPNGNSIYILDKLNGVILEYNIFSGNLVNTIGEFKEPEGMTILHHNKQLYAVIADSGNKHLVFHNLYTLQSIRKEFPDNQIPKRVCICDGFIFCISTGTHNNNLNDYVEAIPVTNYDSSQITDSIDCSENDILKIFQNIFEGDLKLDFNSNNEIYEAFTILSRDCFYNFDNQFITLLLSKRSLVSAFAILLKYLIQSDDTNIQGFAYCIEFLILVIKYLQRVTVPAHLQYRKEVLENQLEKLYLPKIASKIITLTLLFMGTRKQLKLEEDSTIAKVKKHIPKIFPSLKDSNFQLIFTSSKCEDETKLCEIKDKRSVIKILPEY